MKVVCLGDSITYGQHHPRETTWPALLAADTRYEIVNEGRCGDTTRLALERFPDAVQRARPAALVIQFGLNDCNRWQTDGGLPRVSPSAFRANLVEMVDRAKRFKVGKVILATTTPTTKSALFERDSVRYSTLIREVAAEPDVTLLDVREAFSKLKDWPKLLLDGIHLNESGHRVYAGLVAPHLP